MVMKSSLTNTVDIEKLEGALLQEEQVECPLVHRFSDGVYLREITMPAGSVIVGHRHTTTHMNIISKGSCIILDQDTGDTITVEAPCTFESSAGIRKTLYIIEECVWTTVHVTTETDISKLERTLVEQSDTFIKHKRKEIS